MHVSIPAQGGHTLVFSLIPAGLLKGNEGLTGIKPAIFCFVILPDNFLSFRGCVVKDKTGSVLILKIDESVLFFKEVIHRQPFTALRETFSNPDDCLEVRKSPGMPDVLSTNMI